jgi:hypothetical protein|tara:strand:+ start:138 stop:497 length:360 start_codon:yes stop_codon:yes gene_type:complete
MDDLEICKRIANIEGICFCLSRSMHNVFKVQVATPDEAEPCKEYNPLKDDALCFQLAKKYRVSIDYFEDWQRQGEDKDVLARLEIGLGIHALGTVDFCKNDDSLNKAICLAIIEAHKES